MPTEFNLHVESKNKNTRLTDREQIGIARRGEEVEKKNFFLNRIVISIQKKML